MYCSTCGAHVPAGRAHCTTCGAPAHPAAGHVPTALARPLGGPAAGLPATAAHTCHRCGYAGEGVSYFSKGSHVAGLVVLALVSAGLMGLFALIYYLSYHEHRICPRCGKDWGKRGALLPAVQGAPWAVGQPAQTAVAVSGGGGKQGLAIAFFVLAAVLVMAGIGELEAGMVLTGAGFGVAGGFLHRAAAQEREVRRAAILSGLQLPVLKLAAERQGRLTVTEVAAALGWTLPRAEKVLNSLDDGLRVSSDVTDEGVIVYEFRELAHAQRLPGPAA